MLGSDAARCGLTIVLAIFAARHVASLAALAPVAAVLGGCSAVFLPASYAIMPSLLSEERLPGGNALYAGVLQVGSLLGPVIGGVVVATTGPAIAFGADAGPADHPRGVRDGELRPHRIHGGRASRARAHAVRRGRCSLAGTLIVAKVGGRARPTVLIGAVFLVAAVAIGLTPFLGGLPGAAGAMLVFGIALGFDSVLSVTLLQRWAPPDMLGRMMGLVMLASVGSFPLSAAVAGLLTRHLGPSPVFPIAGALLAAAVLAGLTQREFRDFGAQVQGDASDVLASEPTAP